MPPQRVTSACRQSTQPIRLRKSASDIGVLAGGDVERRSLAHEPQPGEVGRRDRLLEPAYVPFVDVARGPAQCLLRRERAVRVDVQLGVADRRRVRRRAARVAPGSRPSFIFTRGMPCSTQPPAARRAARASTSRSRRCRRRARGRARRAAARRAARRAGARGDPRARGRRPRAPERDPGSAGVPQLRSAVEPDRGDAHRVERRERCGARRSSTIVPAASGAYVQPRPRVAPARGFDDDDRRRVPLERPVGLRQRRSGS